MPGSGKSSIISALKASGLEALNLGDGVRAEAKRRNLEPTGDNLGKLMLELREKNGPGAIAELLTEPIKNSKAKVIVIDGVRSTAEIEVLKNVGSVKLLSIDASTDTRYKFLSLVVVQTTPQQGKNLKSVITESLVSESVNP